jgi:prephenate dehydrogenase
MASDDFRTLAIVGAGLIGSSFGLALKEAGFGGERLGVSSPAALDAAMRIGAISRAVSLEEAAARADLIYLAQPVARILETLRALGPLIRPGTLVTDAGSTKAVIVQTAAEYLPRGAFAGGHPMAGKEQRGAEAADASLFRRRPYVLTPDPAAPPPRLEEFKSWLARIGARVVEMTAAEHDTAVAFTSHLPQILSTALAETLQRQKNPDFERVFGPGLLDMTRLALSDPDLWASIFASNSAKILAALDLLLSALGDLHHTIQRNGDIAPLFQSAAAFASSIRKPDDETTS